MTNKFEVRLQRFSNLMEIAGSWENRDFIAVLELLEFDGIADLNDAELRDMCIMSLQDLEPEAASALLLKYRMSDKLNDGQIRNLSWEMLDEKMWEEYADYALHERFFSIGSMLYAAFPKICPEPDAVSLCLEVTAKNESGKALLSQPLSESFLVRLLADGMSEDSVLHRLFEQNLASNSFPDADTIIWIVNSEWLNTEVLKIELISSGYWLDALKGVKTYESSAFPDHDS